MWKLIGLCLTSLFSLNERNIYLQYNFVNSILELSFIFLKMDYSHFYISNFD